MLKGGKLPGGTLPPSNISITTKRFFSFSFGLNEFFQLKLKSCFLLFCVQKIILKSRRKGYYLYILLLDIINVFIYNRSTG